MDDELLPCPFCGGKPEITKHFKEDVWSLIHRCKVIGSISWGFSDKERHISMWNTRHHATERRKGLDLPPNLYPATEKAQP